MNCSSLYKYILNIIIIIVVVVIIIIIIIIIIWNSFQLCLKEEKKHPNSL